MEDKECEEINRRIQKKLDEQFLHFCTLEELDFFDIKQKRNIYYFVSHKIVEFVCKSCFTEALNFPSIKKLIVKIGREGLQKYVTYAFIFGTIFGASIATLCFLFRDIILAL